MNRFRKLGFIRYNGEIQVHPSLLNIVLHDQYDPRRNPAYVGWQDSEGKPWA
jgi:hypothetical protein